MASRIASVGVDGSGHAAIEWGVYGVPKPFYRRPRSARSPTNWSAQYADNIDSALKAEINKTANADTTSRNL